MSKIARTIVVTVTMAKPEFREAHTRLLADLIITVNGKKVARYRNIPTDQVKIIDSRYNQ